MTGWMLCLITLVMGQNDDLARYEASQPHMGTSFNIVVYAPNKELAEKAFGLGFARISQLDGVMSDYDPTSELSKLSNSSPTESPVPLSVDLFEVLSAAQALSLRSEGAFDITVGPLTKLWRRARRRGEFPNANLFSAARAATGFRHLKLHPDTKSAELIVPGMRLDLGAIAKGYAADEALRSMAGIGVTRAIINAGGDVVAGEAPPGEAGWRVAIASLEQDAPPNRFLRLANGAVATSGDLWQHVEIEGVRYSHILDPKTGLGLTSHSSVTIVAPTGMSADSLASAVSVLGATAGLKLVEETPSTETLIMTQNANGTTEFQSTGFSCLLESALPKSASLENSKK